MYVCVGLCVNLIVKHWVFQLAVNEFHTIVSLSREVSMANNTRRKPGKLSVYLYIPNIVGELIQTRVLFCCYFPEYNTRGFGLMSHLVAAVMNFLELNCN